METLEHIVDAIADELGRYGAHDERCADGTREPMCRTCWVTLTMSRIRYAVQNEAAREQVNKALDALNEGPEILYED